MFPSVFMLSLQFVSKLLNLLQVSEINHRIEVAFLYSPMIQLLLGQHITVGIITNVSL